MGEKIRFSADGEHYEGYVACSAHGTGPGVLVIQEYWGLVPHIMDVCDRFANEGFTALSPDLYKGTTTSDPDEAATLMQALHIGETELILRKAIDVLLTHPATQPRDRIGAVGFCMGGQLALFAAGHNPAIQATVDFYGIHPKVVPDLRGLNGPLLGLFAEHDPSTSGDVVKKLGEELTLLGKRFQFHTYPGTQHAFFNDQRPAVYNEEAAKNAWHRTVAFLRDELAA